MDLDLLHIQDCPNLELMRRRVREALQGSGTKATIREQLVVDDDAAERLGFRGSPTILIDGRDPFATNGVPNLSCRLYMTEAGAEGAPSVRQLVAALFSREDGVDMQPNSCV